VQKAYRSLVPEVSRAEFKRAGLRRMRAIALSLLALMTAIFVATSITSADWPWIPYVRAFAEAAMVGACADWFAVVALFRHPLGLPIPHTAIVPNNKDRIGVALGRFITDNFLNPREAHQHILRIDVVGAMTRWLNKPGNVDRLARQVAGQLAQIMRAVPAADLGDVFGHVARRSIESIPAAPLAAKALSVLWAGGAAQAAIERGIVLGESTLALNKPKIMEMVSEHSGRWVPRWIDRVIAEKVTAGLLETLQELRNLDHPWRLELAQAVQKFITELATDPQMHAMGERIKSDLLSNPLIAEQARALWIELERGVHSGLRERNETVAAAIAAGLGGLARWLEETPERRRRINRTLRLLALRAVLPRRAEIGAYVTQVVQNWDSATLVERLELQVGGDLQYIRINGTLVGGLVGLLIYTVSQWFAA
jgi:uncharacterized membrane-anchored protein YjiN (DUF445 family)